MMLNTYKLLKKFRLKPIYNFKSNRPHSFILLFLFTFCQLSHAEKCITVSIPSSETTHSIKDNQYPYVVLSNIYDLNTGKKIYNDQIINQYQNYNIPFIGQQYVLESKTPLLLNHKNKNDEKIVSVKGFITDISTEDRAHALLAETLDNAKVKINIKTFTVSTQVINCEK